MAACVSHFPQARFCLDRLGIDTGLGYLGVRSFSGITEMPYGLDVKCSDSLPFSNFGALQWSAIAFREFTYPKISQTSFATNHGFPVSEPEGIKAGFVYDVLVRIASNTLTNCKGAFFVVI